MRQQYSVRELEELESFLEGAGPYVFAVVQKHMDSLSLKMLSSLRSHEDRKAGEYRAAMEELAGLKDLIKQRIKVIQESQEE